MYERFSESELAKRLSDELGLTETDAVAALNTPGLGREWAVSLLESRARHDLRQQRISHHRENLRRAATG